METPTTKSHNNNLRHNDNDTDNDNKLNVHMQNIAGVGKQGHPYPTLQSTGIKLRQLTPLTRLPPLLKPRRSGSQ